MKRLFILTLALGFFACGDSPTDPPPPPTPTPTPLPASADLHMSLETGELCLSPLPEFTFRTTVPITVREDAGLEAHLNFMRFSLYRNGAEIERSENGADDIVAQLGTNLVPASGSLRGTAVFDFNNAAYDALRVEANLTDARGNTHSLTVPDFLVFVVPACTQVSSRIGAEGQTILEIVE